METILEFFKWYYVESFLFGDIHYGNLIIPKTILLLIGLALGLGIVGKILILTLNALNWLNHRGWQQKH